MKHARNLSLTLFFCGAVLSTQVRESIVIVRPMRSNEGMGAYRLIAGYLRNKNLTDLADNCDSLTRVGFESGYLATDRYGRSIVVKNRLVFTFANSAMVTVVTVEGKEKLITDCPVICEGADIDYALLLLPEGASKEVTAIPSKSIRGDLNDPSYWRTYEEA